MIWNWLKRFWCDHNYGWLRNLYGDQINYSGGKRSIWMCTKCLKTEYRAELHNGRIKWDSTTRS